MSLINVLKELFIHPNIVEIIADIYCGDSTDLYLNKEKILNIEISSGVRQGCTLSALLFILVTYKIIDSIQRLQLGYHNEDFNISSLFYMDDAAIFFEDEFKMRSAIGRIENICGKYGLRLNKQKCKILRINVDSGEDEIEGIQVVQSVKYLGVLIDNKKKCFEAQKAKIFNNGNKYVAQIFSILGGCCNRMLIGKTYWKGLVLQVLLYCAEIIQFNDEELKKLQTFDNKAYRLILKVPDYTAIEFLRGEIGASSAKARDLKNKLLFLKHSICPGGNKLLSELVHDDMEHKKTNWSKVTHKYLNLLGKTMEQIRNMKKSEIERAVIQWDNDKWRDDMASKRTMERYRNNKSKPEEVTWFRNDYKCSLMMRARSDSLSLGWRGLSEDRNKSCKLCNTPVETLKHFILECCPLQQSRMRFAILQFPRPENTDILLNNILLFDTNLELDKYVAFDIIATLWNKRNNLIENIN